MPYALSDAFEKLVDDKNIQETIDHECKTDQRFRL